jgi:histidinol dehydrogenase
MFNVKISNQVAKIIENVRTGGDKAVIDYTKAFDKVDLCSGLKVPYAEIKNAVRHIPTPLKQSILTAFKNITFFHMQEFKRLPRTWMANNKGLLTGQKYEPIESVGIYVPGGKFSYPSTVLMTAIAARIAGVEKIAIATPPAKINHALLFAASLCDIKDIYKVGGAVAVAGLAYGTETIKKVNMIAGPGNIYVNEAKRQVFGQVGIDSLAGPSEVAIIADDATCDDYIINDLMAQAEHDGNARAFVFCTRKKQADRIYKSLEKGILNQVSFEVCSIKKAIERSNEIAPEHLELLIKDAENFIPLVKNAGAIFAGCQTPTASGDYWAGPSHVLPTGSSAKFSSGLSVASFLKRSSIIVMPQSNKNAYKQIAEFAENEGLIWHKKSALIRLK